MKKIESSQKFISRLLGLAIALGFICASPLFANVAESTIRPIPRGEAPAAVQKTEKIPDLKSVLDAADLSGEISIALIDMETGELVEGSGETLALPPASVTKALTTLYALESLGPQFRFVSDLRATGPIKNGIIQGDLVFAGSGDPIFDSDAAAEMIDQLDDAGIKGLSGKFLIYDKALPYQEVIDKDQPRQVGYNPAISGANMNFNRIYALWNTAETGIKFFAQAWARKHRPNVEFITFRAAGRELPIFEYEKTENEETWSIAQKALGQKGSRWLPVRLPAVYTGAVLRALAEQKSILLPEQEITDKLPEGAILARWQGASLSNVTRSMLKFSTNLTAEAVGLKASLWRGTPVVSIQESAYVMTAWLNEKFGTEEIVFVDHSGLSGESQISAKDMATILQNAGWQTPLRDLMKEHLLLDDNRDRLKIEGAVIKAKTGTLNFTSTLAGFIETPGGRKLAFAIFLADEEKRAAISKQDREAPPNTQGWLRKSRALQYRLLRRWINHFDVTG